MLRLKQLLVLLVMVPTPDTVMIKADRAMVFSPTIQPASPTLEDTNELVDILSSRSSFDTSASEDVEGSNSDEWNKDDDDDGESEASLFPHIQLQIGSTQNTVDKVESTYRNWVGPTIGKPDHSDTACYRKAHIMRTCPVGYSYKMKTCWTECPLSYPVECGMECIRQNDDCGLEVATKAAATINVALNFIKKSFFFDFKKLAKSTQRGITCARSMLSSTKTILKYIRTIMVKDPQTPKEQLLLALYQTSYIAIDLPVGIIMCLGKNYPWEILDPTSTVMSLTQYLLAEIISHQSSLLESWDRFKAFLVGANFTEAVNSLNKTDISSLKTGMASNSTCGYDLQRLTDRTWRAIAELKEQNPDISEDEHRVAMSKSELMIYDIPTVTNNCMDQMIAESDVATAYETRDTLRKTYSVIVDDLIESGKSDNGTSLKAKEYTRIVVDKVFTLISILYLDFTRITSLLSEYVQPICGPTQFIGEIDDGNESDTLGLKTVDKAFNGSSLSWTRVGDGVVTIKFESFDTEDVTVNIMSGGDKYDEVEIAAGDSVTWKSNVTDLGGKTLYLDRWRPGFLGITGTGGGSLKLWVPRASDGGHLDLMVKINVS